MEYHFFRCKTYSLSYFWVLHILPIVYKAFVFNVCNRCCGYIDLRHIEKFCKAGFVRFCKISGLGGHLAGANIFGE